MNLDKNPSVSLNVCETGRPLKESSESEVISSGESSSLFAFSEEAEKVSPEKEKNLINELGLDKNPSVSLNVWETGAPLKESSDSEVSSSDSEVSSSDSEVSSSDSEVLSSDEPSSLFAFFEEAEKVSAKSLSLTINLMPDTSRFWLRELCRCLKKVTSLNSLTLAINNYSDIDHLWVYELGEALAESASSNSLKLAINNYGDSDSDSHWGHEYLYDLKRMKSECSFTFNICGK